jgi:hypothetical protein
MRPFGHPVQFGFGSSPAVDVHLQRAASLLSHREAALAVLNVAYMASPDQVGANAIRDLLDGVDRENSDG